MAANTGMSLAVVSLNDESTFSYLFAPDTTLIGNLRVLSSAHIVSDVHLKNAKTIIEIFSKCPSIALISIEEKISKQTYNEQVSSNKQTREKDIAVTKTIPTLNTTVLQKNIRLKSGYNSITVTIPFWVANGTHTPRNLAS